ncbi:MAG: ORC1-type DNA replication protein [Candidatus Altiarchaeia archaeon]
MKPGDILMDGETLFQNESVFTPAYVPKDFIHRDSELGEIMLALKPGLRGVAPVNALVYGPPGTGKTSAVKYAFEELKQASKKLLPVYINCEDNSTPYAIFAKIYEAVYGLSPPSTGKPIEDVKERVFSRLKKEDRSLVVALDELDRLAADRTIDRVLVDFLKAHSTYGYDKIGIIGITIKEDLLAGLDEKTRSVYNPTRILFQRYKKNEIKDILGNRARHGFYDGALSDGLLTYIADKTYDSGDLRTGIDLMRRSGLLAEKEAVREITKEHVEKALGNLPRERIQEAEEKLLEEDKSLLERIKKKESWTSGDLYKNLHTEKECSTRKYNEILAKLEKMKLITTEYRTGIRGRSREIKAL